MAKKKVATRTAKKPVSVDPDESMIIENEEDLTSAEKSSKPEDNYSNEKPAVDEGPRMTDPGWTQAVLDQLEEDEMYDGAPKADGLRRLVEKIIGPIISIDNVVVEAPKHGAAGSEKNTATVTSRMQILSTQYNRPFLVSATADANDLSCSHPFNKYLSSMAETRAEARVYRKALRLKNVVSSEEIGSDTHIIKEQLPDSSIIVIDRKCRDIDIDVKKTFEIGLPDIDVKRSIRDYSVDESKIILDKLHTLQKKLIPKDGKKTPEKPAELGSYDPQWKDYFG